MAQLSWILLILLVGVCLIQDYVSADKVCKYGGSLDKGVCACLPWYTGEDCGIKMEGEAQEVVEVIQRNLENCNAAIISVPDFASGSGSGDGSAMSETPRPLPTNECQDSEKRVIDGKCEFVRRYKGVMELNVTSILPASFNESSESYGKAKQEARCLIWSIFSILDGVLDVSILNISTQDSMEHGIRANYVIMTSSEVTSQTLTSVKDTAALSSLAFYKSTEISNLDECAGENQCSLYAECTDTYGSYMCSCMFNYTNMAKDGERSGSKCRHVCDDEEGNEFCKNKGVCRITVEGSGVCVCPSNYAGERCDREWHIFLNATIGVTAALGVSIIIFVIVAIMLCARNRIKSGGSKSNFMEMESNSPNGEYMQNKQADDDNQVKGISNPYVSPDEGITVATKVVEDDSELVQDDKL